MITTEFYYGQGFGNQLAVYVTTRAIALRNGYEFGFTGLENFGDRRYNDKGVYFMDLDLGLPVDISAITNYYKEKEYRIKLNTSQHDATIGCDIRLTDYNVLSLPDNCKIDGLLQSEDYFYDYKNDIKKWLCVKPEYDIYDFSNDDVCILNIRDYEGDDTLFLSRTYWVNAINHMLSINPQMTFAVITENPNCVKNLLPELSDNVFHIGVGEDYSIIKNAKWLILSNSSFGYFPALTNELAKLIIAPKYWARHNISNGYWSMGCNLYKDFIYMDRFGNLQTYDECKRELNLFINQTKIYLK